MPTNLELSAIGKRILDLSAIGKMILDDTVVPPGVQLVFHGFLRASNTIDVSGYILALSSNHDCAYKEKVTIHGFDQIVDGPGSRALIESAMINGAANAVAGLMALLLKAKSQAKSEPWDDGLWVHPGNPVAGDYHMDKATGKFRVFTGQAWVVIKEKETPWKKMPALSQTAEPEIEPTSSSRTIDLE